MISPLPTNSTRVLPGEMAASRESGFLFTQALQCASLQGSDKSIELGSNFGGDGCTGTHAGDRRAIRHQGEKSLLGGDFLRSRKGIEQAEQGRAISKGYRQSGSFHCDPLVIGAGIGLSLFSQNRVTLIVPNS